MKYQKSFVPSTLPIEAMLASDILETIQDMVEEDQYWAEVFGSKPALPIAFFEDAWSACIMFYDCKPSRRIVRQLVMAEIGHLI